MAAVITPERVTERVREALPHDCIDAMVEFVCGRNPRFWGGLQSIETSKLWTMIALYKCVEGCGYNYLNKGLVGFPFGKSNATLVENISIALGLLNIWAKKQIELGTRHEWDASVEHLKLDKHVKHARLWIDSTDCPLTKNNDRHGSSRLWSYKLHSAGLRYTVLADGRRRIRATFGGYSPKVHDRHFIRNNKEFFNTRCRGVSIVAGSEYYPAQSDLSDCTLLAYPKVKAAKSNGNSSKSSATSSLDAKKIESIRESQALMDSVLSSVKKNFSMLEKKFHGDLQLHTCAFNVSCAIHNWEIEHSRTN